MAVVVAGLFLSVLGRMLAGAWSGTRTPMEVLSSVTIARSVLAREPEGATARERGFVVVRDVGRAEIVAKPSRLAPAPLASAKPGGSDGSPPADSKGPNAPGQAQPNGPAAATLQRVSVRVRTPSGRAITFETVRLDASPP